MKLLNNLELLLWALTVISSFSFLAATYEVVNKKKVPLEWFFVFTVASYVAIHVYNGWV